MDQDSPQTPISETAAPQAIVDADGITQFDGRDSKVVIKQQAPNTQATISSVINGAFNGLSLAAIPASFFAMLSEANDGRIGKGKIIGTALGTVALAGGGAYWGLQEANKLKNYRDTIADEVGRLEDRLECLERIHTKSHTQRAEDRNQAPSSPQIS